MPSSSSGHCLGPYSRLPTWCLLAPFPATELSQYFASQWIIKLRVTGVCDWCVMQPLWSSMPESLRLFAAKDRPLGHIISKKKTIPSHHPSLHWVKPQLQHMKDVGERKMALVRTASLVHQSSSLCNALRNNYHQNWTVSREPRTWNFDGGWCQGAYAKLLDQGLLANSHTCLLLLWRQIRPAIIACGTAVFARGMCSLSQEGNDHQPILLDCREMDSVYHYKGKG